MARVCKIDSLSSLCTSPSPPGWWGLGCKEYAEGMVRGEKIPTKKTIILLFLLFLPTVSFADSILEQRAHALNQEVRCPVCLGQSIADSETIESEALKTFIYERLSGGDSDEIIREKLRNLYGDEILFLPPFETHTLFLWLAPFGFFLLMLFVFLWKGYHSHHKTKSIRQ